VNELYRPKINRKVTIYDSNSVYASSVSYYMEKFAFARHRNFLLVGEICCNIRYEGVHAKHHGLVTNGFASFSLPIIHMILQCY
jgi:hypothetical protein